MSRPLRRPPDPFDPEVHRLEGDEQLYRVYANHRHATDFNPGKGSPSRFGFFGSPVVPILYAAHTEIASVCETLLHDVPVEGGFLTEDDYADRVMARLRVVRPLRLAALYGTGLRRVKASEEDVSAADASRYGETVAWAEAAHAAGLDGVAWMSHRCNDQQAFVFFGDRCTDAFEQDPGYARAFDSITDKMWLIDVCAPLGVEVL